jgi:hypothetical protein
MTAKSVLSLLQAATLSACEDTASRNSFRHKASLDPLLLVISLSPFSACSFVPISRTTKNIAVQIDGTTPQRCVGPCGFRWRLIVELAESQSTVYPKGVFTLGTLDHNHEQTNLSIPPF